MASTTNLSWVESPWGAYLTVFTSPETTVKILRVNPHQSLSLQYHERRDEHWTLVPPTVGAVRFIINGRHLTAQPDVRYHVPRKVLHRITNDSDIAIQVLEVITGEYDEDDIVRISDKYGRV